MNPARTVHPMNTSFPYLPFRPTTDQLLSLSSWSPANNAAGLNTALHWKSDVAGSTMRQLFGSYRQLQQLAKQLPPFSPWALSLELSDFWLRTSLLESIRNQTEAAVAKQQDPDPFRQQNAEIESRYAELIKAICELCFIEGHFSQDRAEKLLQASAASLAFYQKLAELAVLEYRYNSLGLTRLVALKELLTSLLMLITKTPASARHPYRRYDEQGQPSDAFEDYLAQCQLRLEQLYRHDAFDPVKFSEHSPAAHMGCCEHHAIEGSEWHGVKLRYYPSAHPQADRKPVLYLNSPLINRPEIYDLARQKSVIEGLINAGHHVYLVDYAGAGEQAHGLGLEFFGKQVHDRYLALIQQRTEQPIQAMGYCMGGTLLLTYLARRAEEREAQGLPMDITRVVLMATPVYFDDASSGHAPMRQLIRDSYDAGLIGKLFDGCNVPPQLIEAGMQQIQPGVRYTVTRGFFERATFDGAIEDAAPFLNWLNHGTRFPAKAHRQWIEQVFLGNQIFEGQYRLPSDIDALDGQPVDMDALTRAGVQIMDYRGSRDPISPIGSCIASETWGAQQGNRSATTNGLNRTIEKNIGHIFVVSRKHLSEYLEQALAFYQAPSGRTLS